MSAPELVATLIAGCGPELFAATFNDCLRRVRESTAQSVSASWLAEHEAADIFASGMEAGALYKILRESIADAPVDVLVQPAATRRKKLLLADMESTIIEQEMLDELAAATGIGARVADITRRAMNGELDFAAALRERVALLKGVPEKLLSEAARRITLMPGAATLLATMKKHGAPAWLVTGGFTYFAEPIAAHLGFDRCFANSLTLKDGAVSGDVGEPILGKLAKREALERAQRELGIAPEHCLCVGDGANDVPMLAACNTGGGLGVAFQAKPAVRDAIPHQINHAGLTALLYAQGYRKEELISSSRT